MVSGLLAVLSLIIVQAGHNVMAVRGGEEPAVARQHGVDDHGEHQASNSLG